MATRRSARRGGRGSGRGEGGSSQSNETPDIAGMIAQQLTALIPTIVTQVASAMANEHVGGANGSGAIGGGANGTEATNNGNNNGKGCTYKDFTNCKPKEYDGKGGILVYTRWIEKMEAVIDISNCADDQRVKYVAGSLTDKALTWWNLQIQARGREAALGMQWEEFKALMYKEFCPGNELQRLENEFWNHSMIGANHAEYTDRFHELAKLVPHLVTPESERIKRYIYGLVPQIRGTIKATEPPTLQSAILKAGTLTDEMVRNGTLTRTGEKRKENEESNKQGNARQEHNKKARNGKAFIAAETGKKEYEGPYPKCNQCNFHHPTTSQCRLCTKCNRFGHLANNCRTEVKYVTPLNIIYPKACYECGDPNHFRNACPRLNRAPTQGGNSSNQVLANKGNNSINNENNGNRALGRAFVIGANEACQHPDIATGMSFLNKY